MPRTTGKAATKAFFRALPENIERRLLRGAAGAAIGVLKEEAADRVISDEVRNDLQTNVRKREDRIVATLSVKPGWARSVATWLEYGTDPHFITVDQAQSGGRTAVRVNALAKQGTLVINGKPVGASVWHPGARAHPFMRVSLDMKGDEAVAAAQQYVTANAARIGFAIGGGEE